MSTAKTSIRDMSPDDLLRESEAALHEFHRAAGDAIVQLPSNARTWPCQRIRQRTAQERGQAPRVSRAFAAHLPGPQNPTLSDPGTGLAKKQIPQFVPAVNPGYSLLTTGTSGWEVRSRQPQTCAYPTPWPRNTASNPARASFREKLRQEGRNHAPTRPHEERTTSAYGVIFPVQ